MEQFADTSTFVAKVATTLAAGTGNKTLKVDSFAGAAAVGLTAEFRIIIGSEIMKVTSGAGTTTWTVERGLEKTTAALHNVNDNIFHKLTGGALEDSLALASTIKPEVVTSKTKALGALGGTNKIKPNLAEGRVFTATTSTSSVAVETPINPPAAGEGIYVEVVITGNKAITVPAASKWLFGTEPVWDYSSSSSVNVVSLVSWDGATWYGVGSEGLPAGVVILASPSADGGIKRNSANTAWEQFSIPSSGIDATTAKNIADEEIIAKAFGNAGTHRLLTSGNPPVGTTLLATAPTSKKLAVELKSSKTETELKLESGFSTALYKGQQIKLISGVHSDTEFIVTADVAPSATSIPINHKPNFSYPVGSTVELNSIAIFEWRSLAGYILENAPARIHPEPIALKASEKLKHGKSYLVSKSGVTLTLESSKEGFTGIALEGEPINVKNISSGTVSILGDIDQTVGTLESALTIAGGAIISIPLKEELTTNIPNGSSVTLVLSETQQQVFTLTSEAKIGAKALAVESKVPTYDFTTAGTSVFFPQTTIPLQAGESITFVCDTSPFTWRVLGGWRNWSAIDTAMHSTWEGFTLTGKVSQKVGGNAHGSRVEANGSVTRLRGSLTVETVIKETINIMTIKAATHRPPVETQVIARLASPFAIIAGGTATWSLPLNIATNGQITTPAGMADLPAGVVISLDNIAFPIT